MLMLERGFAKRLALTLGLGAAFVTMSILASSSSRAQDPGYCFQIGDGNQQAYCRAISEHKEGICASIIGNSDLQWECRALASGKSNYCASIRRQDRQAFCKAVTK